MPSRSRDAAIWLLLLVFAAFNAFKPWMPGTAWMQWLPAVSILTMVGFVLLHGPRQIGWLPLGVFFAAAFAVSWTYESLSIATGFPFGHYHYTDKMGPKLGTVPLLIMPAYFCVCYVSWYIAQALLDRFAHEPDTLQTWVQPLLAALIMVMWDMSMDPARSTVAGAWSWRQGGGYFGVPFVNFMGWLLCVWTIFQAWALYLRAARPTSGHIGRATDRREHWLQMVALYAALIPEFIAFALWPPAGTATDPAGAVWRLKDLYETLGLVAVFSMCFVVLLAATKLLVAAPSAWSGAGAPRP